MARFYFHLRDGRDVLLDPDGSELADMDAVRARALADARSIMSADILEGRLKLDMRVDVEDQAGRIVHRLPFVEAVEIVPANNSRESGPRPLSP